MPPIRHTRHTRRPAHQVDLDGTYHNDVKAHTRVRLVYKIGAPDSRCIVILDCSGLALARVLLQRGWLHITVVENIPATHDAQQVSAAALALEFKGVVTLVSGELLAHLQEVTYDAAIMDFMGTYSDKIAPCIHAFSIRAPRGANLEVVLSSRNKQLKVDDTAAQMAVDMTDDIDVIINDVHSYRSWNPEKQAYTGSAGMVCYSYTLGCVSEKPVEYHLFRWNKQSEVVDTLLWNGTCYK